MTFFLKSGIVSYFTKRIIQLFSTVLTLSYSKANALLFRVFPKGGCVLTVFFCRRLNLEHNI